MPELLAQPDKPPIRSKAAAVTHKIKISNNRFLFTLIPVRPYAYTISLTLNLFLVNCKKIGITNVERLYKMAAVGFS